MSSVRRIALIGYGEVGQTLAADLYAAGLYELHAWDVLFDRPDSVPSGALASGAVHAASSAAGPMRSADVVISAVTASQCVEAARSASCCIERDAYFIDLNSVSPATKAQAAHLIEAGGGRYIEAAVMSPIGPRRSASPMLLGGPHAAAFMPIARALGFAGMRVYSDVVGRASAAKMCRSVMVKGIEALLAESLLAARHYGVEGDVLASLEDLLPVGDWERLARYMISRSLQHGERRADEMREVAKTVADAGLDPWMSEACASRQDWAARYGEFTAHEPLVAMLDAIRNARREPAGVTSA